VDLGSELARRHANARYAMGEHGLRMKVAPYDDSVHEEPAIFAEGFGPAGQLWSTPSDLCRLGLFLAKPSGDVLAERTVTEMHRVQTIVDDDWTLGFGLGPMLRIASWCARPSPTTSRAGLPTPPRLDTPGGERNTFASPHGEQGCPQHETHNGPGRR